jgi:hypothetical protein
LVLSSLVTLPETNIDQHYTDRSGDSLVGTCFLKKKQQRPTDHNSRNPGPHRNVDSLPVLYRQFERTRLDLMGVLGLAETVVHQPKDTGCYEHDCRNHGRIHYLNFETAS